MPLQVGSPAPAFKADAYLSADGEIKTIELADYQDSWLCLFFYPFDFSSLCPSEITGFDKLLDEFEKRKCAVVGCSCDSIYAHKGWCASNEELSKLRYLLMSDFNKRIAMDYGVLLAERGAALRGTFLIDPQGVLRYSAVNDLPIGRNIHEILRILDALQTGEACPCNWKPANGE